MVNTPTPNNQYINVSKLERSSLNARKTAPKTACDELKASILAHGLMQNLVVTEGKNGKYQVIAGGRRLQALKALQVEGKLPADHSVPCQVVNDEHAYEMSLAENVVRQAMHPADEFEAYAVLYHAGRSVGFIAERFGVTEKHVWQRLKLGKVAPELLKEYRDGNLTLDSLMAFTVTDDPKRQVKVFKSLHGWQQDNPSHIRSVLTDTMVEADSKFAAFVGLETYRKAGGTVRGDLFEDTIYLENPELLQALVSEKLKLTEKQLLAEGWGWVEIAEERDWQFTSQYTTLEPVAKDVPQELLKEIERAETKQREIAELIDAEKDEEKLNELWKRDRDVETRLEQFDERLAEFAKYDPEAIATAGCYVTIGRKGELQIDKGLVKRENRKASKPDAKDKVKGLSESLKRDLEAYRLAAAQAEIAKHPAIAFDLLVFNAAKWAFTMRSPADGPQMSLTRNFCHAASADSREAIQSQMKPIADGLPTGWLKPKSEAEQFTEFQQLTAEQKHSLLAYCVAVTLQPKLGGKDQTAYDIALSQTGANVTDYWRPTAENYLSRVTTEQILGICREIFGDAWTSHRLKSKKSQLVGELHKAFSDPDQHIGTEKLNTWLPEGMAFEPAKPAKAKKGKKAA